MMCFISSALQAVRPRLAGGGQDCPGQAAVSCWFLASELSSFSSWHTLCHFPVWGTPCHLLLRKKKDDLLTFKPTDLNWNSGLGTGEFFMLLSMGRAGSRGHLFKVCQDALYVKVKLEAKEPGVVGL